MMVYVIGIIVVLLFAFAAISLHVIDRALFDDEDDDEVDHYGDW